MPVLLVVFALTLTACRSQESVTAPIQSHPQAAKSGEAALSEGSVETDRAALVAFYVATVGWRSSFDNWLCEVPLDQWADVTTDENGRVTGLDLHYNGLRGPIPPELGNLSSLQTLDLSGNDLSGSIPPELGNLDSLQTLDLSGNLLRGFIPPELGNLENPQYLNLHYNGLRGPIPPELGNLENLQYLELRANGLCGEIPPELGQLENLQTLDLSHNDLSGPIPSELGNLDSLQTLDLSGNQLSQFSGCIPSALLNFVSWLPSCGDEPEPVAEMPEPATELTEAIGLIVRDSGAEIVRVESGQVTGEIEVGYGKETALLSVRFIAEDGDLFTPDEADDFSLGWEIADESIAEVEQHAEDGAWAFHILGLEEGETTIRIKINHEGHSDFVSPEIEIYVEESGPGFAVEITPEIIGLYSTVASSLTDIFFSALVPGTTSVPGRGGGSVEIAGNDWTLQDYSPDGELIANGAINVGMDQTPIPLTGEVILSGSHEAELILNMELSVGTDGLSATGTITINGVEFDVAEVSAAAEAEAAG